MLDASPHSYLTSVSPHLNLYCEPEAFLSPAARGRSSPSPSSVVAAARDDERPRWRSLGPRCPDASSLRVYASCGSVVWRYWVPEALGALTALAEAVATTEHARALISLGGHALPPDLRARLRHPRVDVADYVDQWRVLERASSSWPTTG